MDSSFPPEREAGLDKSYEKGKGRIAFAGAGGELFLIKGANQSDQAEVIASPSAKKGGPVLNLRARGREKTLFLHFPGGETDARMASELRKERGDFRTCEKNRWFKLCSSARGEAALHQTVNEYGGAGGATKKKNRSEKRSPELLAGGGGGWQGFAMSKANAQPMRGGSGQGLAMGRGGKKRIPACTCLKKKKRDGESAKRAPLSN